MAAVDGLVGPAGVMRGAVRTTRCPGVPGLVVACGCCVCSACGGLPWGRQPGLGDWCGLGGRRAGRCDAGGCDEVDVGEVAAGALVEPGLQDVEVACGDQEGDEDVLGDLAGCGPVFGVADVDLVALESPVDSFVVGSDGFVGGDPGRGEVGDVLPELRGLEVAGSVGGDGDGRLSADGRQLIGWRRVEPLPRRSWPGRCSRRPAAVRPARCGAGPQVVRAGRPAVPPDAEGRRSGRGGSAAGRPWSPRSA